MAASCLEVWRDSEFEMPTTAEDARAMVADDLECLSIEHDEADLFDIADRIMGEIAACFWTAAAMRSDS
jgi:hypothetical protein